MTKNNRFSLAFEEGRFYGLVDEGEYLRQSLLCKQILPRIPSQPKTICINPVNLVKKASCLSVFVAKTQRNQPNPRLINDLRLRKITYEKITLFLQNEPNFQKVKLNVTIEMKKDYVQMDTWSHGKNKANSNPIQTQYEPNSTRPSLRRSRISFIQFSHWKG